MGLNLFKLGKKNKTEPQTVVNTTSSNETTNNTKEEVKTEGQRDFIQGLVSTKDIIAPSAIEVDFNHIRIDNKYYRTLFIAGYPRFVGINWLSSLINFDASLSVSMYVYPTDGKEVLDDLRRKIAEMEAELTTDVQRGRIVNPSTQAKLEDALNLQQDLVKGEERFFQFGLYVTISAEEKEDLDKITKNLESSLGSLMIISKKATLQMEDGFVTTLPVCDDKLKVTRNMDTTSLATTFPFVSSDLSDDKGIMYGINEHNGSLVVFDRFSMQNYNSVVFATSGAGKSYMVKLELMRSLMFGTEIIVIDPENEYKDLCEAVGGQYIAFGYNEDSKINPFDLSLLLKNDEDKNNALNNKILSLHKLFKVMMGEMDPLEESMLDRAIMAAYKAKGVTPDVETQTKEPPLIEDLYKALIGMEEEGAKQMAARLEKFIKGSFAGIFNQKTTVNLSNKFVVFGIRNLEDTLRPVAMHIILDYIWTIVKSQLKRRILVVDEAWYLMQYDDSASFLRGIIKRGRKYYLGVTTITQDVDDFLKTTYGKEIVTNSAIQILLKQHTAAIDNVGDVFYLSEGEKQLLLSADKGEGIFFAGQNHVAIRIIASESEHKIITSDPEELLRMKQQALNLKTDDIPTVKNVLPPVTTINDEEENEEEEEVATAITKPTETKEEVKVDEVKSEITIKPAVSDKEIAGPLEVQKETEKDDSDNEEATVVMEVGKREEIIEKETIETSKDVVKEEVEEKTETTPEEPLGALERKIALMEEEEKKKVEDHEKKIAEEAALKKAEEEKNKTLYSAGLPKYQDLFKSYTPSGGAGASTNKSIGSGVLPPLTPPPLPKINEEVKKPVDNKVNPFGPKNVPAPDLTKVKPMTPVQTPTKPGEDKIDRGKVKVEVESPDDTRGKPFDNAQDKPIDSAQGKPEVKPDVIKSSSSGSDNEQAKTEEKKDDKKGMSYDDLFGN